MYEWWQDPDKGLAHAFPVGQPGWSRSACREVNWTARLGHATPRTPRCPDCLAAVLAGTIPEPAMSEGEAAMAWGR
jgi:hypothetical protein